MSNEDEQFVLASSEPPTVPPTEYTEEQGAGEGEEEVEVHHLEDEGEDYPRLGSSSEDAEKAACYREYKRLVKEIHYQNETIQGIKAQIHAVDCKPCPSSAERNQLRNLYDCLEQEMHKLRRLTNKAIQLQNFGSRRLYKEINLVTSFDEDIMAPIAQTCETMQVQTSQRAPIRRESGDCWRASGGDTTSDMAESCSCNNCTNNSDETEEQRLMKEIYAALQTCACANNGNNKKSLKKKSSMEKLKQKICQMHDAMNKLKQELCAKNEGKSSNGICSCHDVSQKPSCPPPKPPSCLPPKAQEFKKLKDNYMHLLMEFTKKDEELKELTKKVKTVCGSAGNDADTSEIHLLTSRIDDLKEEQIEFKCLMREQSLQLEDYRTKYLNAQQKVEEQSALIEKLNMNNKRIEKQINLEIKEIRCKFQDKLKELLQYPKLLENEQIKVAKMCKEKEDLESKLMIVCKELKSLKAKAEAQNASGGAEDCKPKLKKCEEELERCKKNLDEVQRQRDMFCEQLKVSQEDVDCLRSESAKIIARLKERSELIKQQQQEQINRLEKQLAQCRATACLSVSDRECVIREMQGQLNTLSYSFDSAQKQIKTLRNHIAYMSNENCFPAKC